LQCGICVATCPEKVIKLEPQFNLADSAMAAELVIEDIPFSCTECGKPFGSTRSIEKVISKLSDHSMFQQSARTDMLKMCEDCRVEAMFAQNDKTMDVGERRKPRTTDDYLN
jgi:ferredoxin